VSSKLRRHWDGEGFSSVVEHDSVFNLLVAVPVYREQSDKNAIIAGLRGRSYAISDRAEASR